MPMDTLKPGFRYDRIADDDPARITLSTRLPEKLPVELPRHFFFSENGAPLRTIYINEDRELFWVTEST